MALTQVQNAMLSGSNNPSAPTVTAVGNGTLAATNTGTYISAFGTNALNSNTSGGYNSAFGAASLYSNTTGNYNTAVGMWALQGSTTSSNNTAVGYQSLYTSTNGPNTAVGYQSAYLNNGGYDNTAVGRAALYSNVSGIRNAAFGDLALQNSTADYNSAFGAYALKGTTTGTRNSAVGYLAGAGITVGSNNTVMGYDASVSGGGADNQIIIGNGLTSAGDNTVSFGKASNVVYNQFTVNASWTRSSDERLKKDIQDDTLGLDFVCKLRPVTHKWKPSNEVPQELTRHYNAENQMDLDAVMNGFIAQEVKQALDECGSPVFGGWSELDDGSQTISREMFIMPLINAIKELNAKVDAQAAEIAVLKAAK